MVNSAYGQLLSRCVTESEKSLRTIAKDAGLDHGTLVRQCQGVQPRARATVVRIACSMALSPAKARKLVRAARPTWTLTAEEEEDLEGLSHETNPIVRESLMKVAIGHLLTLTDAVTTLDDRVKAAQSEAARARQTVELMSQRAESGSRDPVPWFDLDAFLDSSNVRYWPKRDDLVAGRLYRAPEHAANLDRAILATGRALLYGLSGAGKTAIAIGYGLHWRGSHVYYTDVRASATEQDGDEWYRRLLGPDVGNALFIFDNCHLSRRATNRLVSHIEQAAPDASVLFVSGPRVGDSPWDESPEEYFEAFQDGVLHIAAAEHVNDILAAHSKAFCEREPGRFVAVEEDFADPESAAKIRRLIAHDLIAARAALDAWFDAGGRLSDVTENAVLGLLQRRYLTARLRPVIGPLCALGQFEITCHASFLETLPAECVDAARRENLLSVEENQFGQCYRLNLHPQTAALVWRAFLGQRAGIPIERRLKSETFTQLKQYLLSGVENFVEVYRQTFRHGAADLQRDLLADADVQERIRKQLAERPTAEALYYLFGMHRWDAPRAANLLRELVGVATEQIRAELVESGRHVSLVAAQLLDIDADCAKLILGGLEALDVARLASERHPTVALGWISKRPNSVAARLGYGSDWRSTVARHLDMTKVAVGTDSYSSQSWFWFIRDLAASAPEQLQTLIEILGPRRTARLLERLGVGNATRVLHWARATALGDEWFSDIADELDVLALTATIGRRQYLKELYSFLSELPSVTDRFAEAYLRRLTPARVAELLRAPNAGVGALDRLHGVASSQLMADVQANLSTDDVNRIFAQSNLGDIGTFIEHRYLHYRKYYKSFQHEQLPARLASEDLADVGKFLTRIARVKNMAGELADSAIALLQEVGVASRVANNDVGSLGLLMEAVGNVESRRVAPIFEAIPRETLSAAVGVSQARGISVLISYAAKWAPNSMALIGDVVRSADLVDRVTKAPPGDIGHFLWNAFKHVDQAYARDMCRAVDKATNAEWFEETDLVVLGDFLWSLYHLTARDPLSALRHPRLAARMSTDVSLQPGPCLRIIGIMSLDGVDPGELVSPPSAWSDEVKSLFLTWLDAQFYDNPYRFMLGVRALSALDADSLRGMMAPLVNSQGEGVLAVLQEAASNAETQRSIDLVGSTQELIAGVGR